MCRLEQERLQVLLKPIKELTDVTEAGKVFQMHWGTNRRPELADVGSGGRWQPDLVDNVVGRHVVEALIIVS